MPNLKVVVITLILAAAAVAVTFMDGRSTHQNRDARIGQTLIAASDMSAVDQIAVSKGDSAFTLQRAVDGRWSMGEETAFPVDASKIVRLLEDLSKAKFIRVVAEEQEHWSEFGLKEPTKLSLLAGEKQVLDFQMGSRGSSGGFYGAVGGEYKVYLLDPAVAVSTDEASWEWKQLVDIAADQIKSVVFQPQGKKAKAVTLSRAKKEDQLQAEGLSDKEETNTAAAASQTAILSGIRYAKKVDTSNEEAKTALATPTVAVVTLFDGRQYKAEVGTVGKDQPKYFLRLTAETKDAKLEEAVLQDVTLLNTLMKEWNFEVVSSLGKKFEKSRADFVKAKEPATGG